MLYREKVAFFDFCETLVDFQTADAFCDYVRERTKKTKMFKIEKNIILLKKIYLLPILQKLFRKYGSIEKKLKAYELKGFNYSDLDEYAKKYYETRIKPHFIKELTNELVRLKEEGYTVGIVSGGYGIYLKYFVQDFNLDFLLSSNIKIENNICTGFLDGLDCMNERKIQYINKLFPSKPTYSIAFSDSLSDIPLLQYATDGVVVSRNKHQNWVDNNKFKELIWTC
ncbi:HAD-IB family phosphatase [Parabacteroides segnis]|jgi:HAD superfamily hydrolase (TIGR01490 family)|uniref:Haloacid dehalogenase-like hydrolase n=1 Tax=Parabacteroides segnis TaxID=2763058 RepID=A0ABR7E6Q3_9BACT|nr:MULTISPECIES: HAD-IB family phosphatase [Parabacteroides]MBC5644794.1 haloacid dehalogenase-like hydrolase [Parabacteroides segnis]MCM0714504.1 HAD-IB family phosphatase [Parabacteroides sp. TA-V-105]